MLLQDDGREGNPINRFEIGHKIQGEDTHALQKLHVLRKGDHGAEKGEDENPEPVKRVGRKGEVTIEKNGKNRRKDRCPNHFVENDHGVGGVFDVEGVDDRKGGREESRENGDEEPVTVFELAKVNDHDPDHDEGSKDEIDDAEVAMAQDDGFEDRGPESQSGHPDHANGDLGDFD